MVSAMEIQALKMFQFKMTKFWRLFTSDYVQDFVDSVSIPTSRELAEPYTSHFDREIRIHKQKLKILPFLLVI